MMETARKWLPAVVAVLMLVMADFYLGGCAQRPDVGATGTVVGPTTADSMPARLAQGYALNSQIREASARLLKEKKIDVAKAKNVLALTDMGRVGLDTARNLYYAGKVTEAADRLKRVDEVHLEAQAATTPEAKPPSKGGQ